MELPGSFPILTPLSLLSSLFGVIFMLQSGAVLRGTSKPSPTHPVISENPLCPGPVLGPVTSSVTRGAGLWLEQLPAPARAPLQSHQILGIMAGGAPSSRRASGRDLGWPAGASGVQAVLSPPHSGQGQWPAALVFPQPRFSPTSLLSPLS